MTCKKWREYTQYHCRIVLLTDCDSYSLNPKFLFNVVNFGLRPRTHTIYPRSLPIFLSFLALSFLYSLPLPLSSSPSRRGGLVGLIVGDACVVMAPPMRGMTGGSSLGSPDLGPLWLHGHCLVIALWAVGGGGHEGRRGSGWSGCGHEPQQPSEQSFGSFLKFPLLRLQHRQWQPLTVITNYALQVPKSGSDRLLEPAVFAFYVLMVSP